MARPANADPERTRERLLAAAAQHFSRRGAGAASLREVARSAGVTLATIHYYFGDKEALYAACLEHAYLRASEELGPMAEMVRTLTDQAKRAASADELAAAATVGQIVRTGFRFSREHRAIVRLIMRPVLDDGELEPRWRDASLLPFLEQISQLIAGRLGRSAASVRLDLQSLITLIMRYSLSTPAELARVAGLPPDTGDDDAVAAIEAHLVDLAIRILSPVTP